MSSKVTVTEFVFTAAVRVEIRGRKLIDEKWRDQAGRERESRYIRLVTDDVQSGDRMVWRDPEVAHDTDSYYPRGAVGTLQLEIHAQEGFGCKGTIKVLGFSADSE